MGLADYFSTSTVNYFNSAEKKREAWEYENCFEGEKEEPLVWSMKRTGIVTSDDNIKSLLTIKPS